MRFRYFYFCILFFFASIVACQNKPSSFDTEQEQIPKQNLTEKVKRDKYEDDIYVKTIQIDGESSEEKNKCQLSYPFTKYPFINEQEERLALQFKEEFYEEVEKLQEESVAGITFLQHFEVVLHTDSFIVFHIEQHKSYGNNFDDHIEAHYYDLIQKERVDVEQLFKSNEAFSKFVQMAKDTLNEKIKSLISNDKTLSNADRERLWESMQEGIEEGTKANASNFDGVFFNKRDSVRVLFDKYQVAPGSMGVIEIYIPNNYVYPLLKERYQNLLSFPINNDLEGNVTPIKPNITQTTIKQDQPIVALTFDDGPSVYTPKLLDILKEQGVKVTFFVLGKSAKVQQNTILRAYEEGHQIANHSWNHKNLTKVSNQEIKNQVFNTNEIIHSIIHEEPNVFRPPYGALNASVKSISNMPIILWSLDPLDWKDRDAKIVADRMSKAQSNAIILAHDIHKTTVDAIPGVIKQLKEKGYTFVTIDEMFSHATLKKGDVYSKKK